MKDYYSIALIYKQELESLKPRFRYSLLLLDECKRAQVKVIQNCAPEDLRKSSESAKIECLTAKVDEFLLAEGH